MNSLQSERALDKEKEPDFASEPERQGCLRCLREERPFCEAEQQEDGEVPRSGQPTPQQLWSQLKVRLVKFSSLTALGSIVDIFNE